MTVPPGTGKSHLAQAIGFAAIQQGHRVCYREAHVLLDELADAQLAGTRKAYLAHVTTVPLLILDDLGMRKLPHTAAEDLLELIMRRYERASTLITSNRPVEDWGKLLGDTAAVAAFLDRLLHHAHVLTCGPRRAHPAPGRAERPLSGSPSIRERPGGSTIDDLGPTPIPVSPAGGLFTAVDTLTSTHPRSGPAPADLLDQGHMR